MTYAALEATLRLYERGVARAEVPVIRAIAATREEIAARAEALASSVVRVTRGAVRAELEEGDSVIGGGSAPEVRLPTVVVALASDEISAASIEGRLRCHRVPIITRTERDRVIIDLRTVAAEEEAVIVEAAAALAEPVPKSAASN
jgi:L-seryl-tRNA(Ser) seleniumtransferase